MRDLKIPCKKCMSRMEFPFFYCQECGWEPEGAMKERALKFAEKYIRKHPEDEARLRRVLEEMTGKRRSGEVSRMIAGSEMKVPCRKCGSNMMFPFMRCDQCVWVPKGDLRKKAIRFSKIYIRQHPDKEGQLRFILEEEARETLDVVEVKEKKKKVNTRPGKFTIPRKWIWTGLAIIVFLIFLRVTVFSLGFKNDDVIYISIMITLVIAFLLWIMNDKDKMRR
ncbi:MAG: hypothetical protein ACMUHB_07250 [Thermoplasmatota archaeon]